MSEAHEDSRFVNAVTYTVAINVTVAGGARRRTADRRAERLAERLANAAARSKHAVDVTATAGPNINGEVLTSRVVHFSRANSGRGTYGEPAKLDRYLDADHERALASLETVNARQRQHHEADRERRRAVACANAWRSSWDPAASCECVYCEPDRHLDTLTELRSGLQFWSPRCLCGQVVVTAGHRCRRHRDTELVVLDGDPESLTRLSDVVRDVR